ncbi:PepSY domain-containing protein [Mesobacterium sp. TK19101]|uniref:PepSY domain-containing protein n=1 Tax=Mesobacterium hydrothermale TaxID=3111907 RepID=A0ABU6HF76_9RHOB|nr:PepSY domain-containing protein [Mesobacterium sp. TK19101]MEC3861120.1 PepSY domain-containing protein [Mesobacterium sp. TK19101]
MIRILTVALALTATSALASGHGMDKAREDQIRTTLTTQGYEVRKIDMEDGMIEVYALKDGARIELYLDNDLKIVRTKTAD